MKKYVGCKITYNVGNASDAKVEADILRMIQTEYPTAIHLQEVGDREKILRKIAQSTKYHAVIPNGSADHNAILVFPQAKIASRGVTPLSPRRWVGRKVAGAGKDGHARKNDLVWVRYSFNGRKYSDSVVHLVPSHHISAACTLAKLQVGVLTAWFWARTRIAHLSGDFNETRTARCNSLGPLEKIARGWTGETHGQRGIDYWWTLKRQRQLTYDVEVLRGYSSDHRPVKLRIWEGE